MVKITTAHCQRVPCNLVLDYKKYKRNSWFQASVTAGGQVKLEGTVALPRGVKGEGVS